jgi:polynucleotide 5'-kinase involved in rRNA processing
MSAARLKYEQQILTSVRTVLSVNERAIKGVLAPLTGRDGVCSHLQFIHLIQTSKGELICP